MRDMDLTWTFSEWISVGRFQVKSGRIWLGDAQFAPIEQDGLVLNVPVGSYEVFVRQLRVSNGEIRNSRLRVCLEGRACTLGAEVGKTWADTASQGVCDFEIYRLEAGPDYNAYWDRAEYALTRGKPYDVFHLNESAGATLVFCDSAWGDGEFTAYELIDGDERSGVEIEMMDEQDPLPDWIAS